MTKRSGGFDKANYKTRLNYTLAADECMNPEKCVCIFCKRKREEKKNERRGEKRTN